MSYNGIHQRYISAPNLVNICVDEKIEGRLVGRAYHCYDQEPIAFNNVMQLLEEMDGFFDSIAYPQASTAMRSFVKKERSYPVKRAKMFVQQDIILHKGKIATFYVHVQFRQNSTWQGVLIWSDEDRIKEFKSEMEFLNILDAAVEGYLG